VSWNLWLAVAAVNGLLGVAAGAFGAHGLRSRVTPRHLEVFETAARYQMYHALALVAVAWLAQRAVGPTTSAAGWCFLIGIIIFCGTLYAIPLTGSDWWGRLTPIGGLSLMMGWALLAWSALRAAPS